MIRMRHIKLPPTAVLCAALGACGGHGADAPQEARPQVSVVTLVSHPVTLTRTLPGRTSAFLVAEVRPQVNGIVRKRLFEEGGNVKAGQVLFDLDDSLYRASYDSARANLKRAQATAEAARLAARRSAELVRIDAVSVQDNETAIATLGQAEADVAAAQAAVDSGAVSLAYAHIAAPIGGRIGKSSVTAGALVTAGQAAALATIQQLDPLYVEVEQSSSEWLALKRLIDAGRVRSQRAETPARILLEDGTRYAHDGKFQFADVTVEPTTGNFLLRAIVPNPELVLLPGMYVRAEVDEGELPQGLLAPQQGITRDPKGDASAMVVDKDGKVEARNVRVSRAIGDQWLVDEGLASGDRLIVEGLQKIQPGMSVDATERPAPGAATAANR
ncbi:MAG: efflux RND transporter periplasmic adaptor subunit [Steroidobacterales bacterium]